MVMHATTAMHDMSTPPPLRHIPSFYSQIMTNYAKVVPLSCHIDPDVSAFIVTDGDWVWQMVR